MNKKEQKFFSNLDWEFISTQFQGVVYCQIRHTFKAGGKAICFGWDGNGIGKGRGFKRTRTLLITHGGSKNATIVTVEALEDRANSLTK